MQTALKQLIDSATAGVEITETSGPSYPSRRGNVHLTASAVADAIAAVEAGGDDVDEIVRHVVAELAELGGVQRRAAEKRRREEELTKLFA